MLISETTENEFFKRRNNESHSRFLYKDPGARFVRAAEKQLHEPFEKQTVHCTLDSQCRM